MAKIEHKMYAYLWDTLCSTSNVFAIEAEILQLISPCELRQ